MKASKGRPRDPERVLHTLQAARNIELFLVGKTFADLASDLLLQSGVERQFEILGEAASHVSVATQQLCPSINWQGTKDFRNLISHEYFRVDLAKVWDISQHIVPGLHLILEDLFADLDQQFGPDASV
ncbi:DUF86 domain-containing protein [Hymenobacter caeli]|uniref:Uncharacterized protein with HEPN domain n=1 Tax=Hymenobacter caeli TaxID=2735894 RepID=A0ABX2FWZ8_9BACT|nr:HepT-like ribonuclease domain-containing protein [Hymenobacter caeli]NRT21303.1 uncharacterized protein with HEPN domain [Hymenobacter caeli]